MEDEYLKSRTNKLKLVLDYMSEHGSSGITLSTIESNFQLNSWELKKLFEDFALPPPQKILDDLFLKTDFGNEHQLSLFEIEAQNVQTVVRKQSFEFIDSKSFSDLYYTYFDSFLGKVFCAMTPEGLTQLTFEQAEDGLKRLKTTFPNATFHEENNEFFQTLELAFNRQQELTIPIHTKASAFQRKVWNELIHIPEGETRTYGDIAKRLGDPKAARAVGTAIGSNPIAVFIPCHRALASSGKVGKFRWGSELKRLLLVLGI